MQIIFFSVILMVSPIGSLAQIPSVQPTLIPIIVNLNANSTDFNLLNTPNAVIVLSIVGGIIGLACLWLLLCFIRRQPHMVLKLSEQENVSGLYSGDYNEEQWNNQQVPMKATDNIARPIIPPLSLPISNNNYQWDGFTMSESEGGPSMFATQSAIPSVHNTCSSISKKSHHSNNQNNKIYRIDADYENQRYNERPSSYTNNAAGAGGERSRLPSDYRPSEKFPFSEENVFVFENLMHTTTNNTSNSNNLSFAGVDANGIDRSTISISPRATMSSSRQSMVNPLRRDPPSFRASSAHPAYREITRAGGMRSSLEGSMMNRGGSNFSNRRDRDSSDNSLSLRWSESFHSREIERRLDQENNNNNNNNNNTNANENRYTDSGSQTSAVPSPRFKPPPPTQSRRSQQQQQQQQKSQQQSSPRQVVNANDRDIQQVPTRGQVMSLETPPFSSYQQNSPRQPSQSQYDQQQQFSPFQQLLQYEQQQVQYEQQCPPQQLVTRRQRLYEQQYPPQQPQFSPRHKQSQYAQQYHPQQQRYEQQYYDQPQQQQYYQEPPQPQQQYYVQQPPLVQSSSRFQFPSSLSPSLSPRYQPPPPIRTQQSQQKQSSSSRYSSPLYNNGNSDITNNMNNAINATTATAMMEMTNSSRTSFPSPRSRMSYNRQPSPLQQQQQQQISSIQNPTATTPHFGHYNDNSDSDDDDDQLSYAESMLSHHPAIKRQSELYQSRSLAAAISASGANSPRR